MPEKQTIERAKEDKREGKAPSTQAGEFVKEEMEHIRRGKHGAKSTKQAIAIGLSKARRSGVKLPPKRGAKATSTTKRKRRPSSKRSGAISKALERMPRKAASRRSLSRQAKTVAHKRSKADRSRAAKKAARTRKRERSKR
ncbi:MAG TPA: DUF6496 domain-containing protein [Polyangia bacterium]|nr:DUF6496 domain-containing protein [Polyangia bacterium]